MTTIIKIPIRTRDPLDIDEHRDTDLEMFALSRLGPDYNSHGKIERLESRVRYLSICLAKLITVLAGTRALESHEIANMLRVSDLEYLPEEGK